MTGRPSMYPVGLTAQQAVVLTAYARGLSQQEIARDLEISVTTVRSHTRDLFVRLGAANNCHAVAVAIALGLLPADVALSGGSHVR